MAALSAEVVDYQALMTFIVYICRNHIRCSNSTFIYCKHYISDKSPMIIPDIIIQMAIM